jgi:hypothetical protein
MVGTIASNQVWIERGQWTDIVGFDFDGSVNHNVETAVLTYAPGVGGQSSVATHISILNNKAHDLSFGGSHRSTTGAIASCVSSTIVQSTSCNNVLKGNLLYHNNGGATAPVFNDGDVGMDAG